MDRQAKIERVKKTDKVSRAGVQVIGDTNPAYELRFDDMATMTETGELTLFEFMPVTSREDLPTFRGRYDNRTNEIDTDIDFSAAASIGEEFAIRATRDFKAMRGGYEGHHSCVVAQFTKYKLRLKVDPAKFPILGDGLVFDGEITLDRLTFDKHITISIKKLAVTASVRVLDENGNDVTSH